MKKSLYLFSAALLVFVSCTNDFDSSCIKKNDEKPIKNDTISPPKTDSVPVVTVEPILLKKLVHSYANGKETTLELLYNNNKIVSDNDQSNLTTYTYSGDVISKMQKTDNLGNVYLIKDYVYKNGKMDYFFSNEFGNFYKTKFIYNSDGSVFYHQLKSDSLGNEGDETGVSGRYTFVDGNLKTTQYFNGATENSVTYEYDSKNNPRLNILGFDLLIDNQVFANNNVIKKTTKNKDTVVETVIYSYDYDAKGYPVKRTEVTQFGNQTTTETSTYSY